MLIWRPSCGAGQKTFGAGQKTCGAVQKICGAGQMICGAGQMICGAGQMICGAGQEDLYRTTGFVASTRLKICHARLLIVEEVAVSKSQQHAGVDQGQIYIDNCTCCHTGIEVADKTFYLNQSLCTDTGPTSPRANHVTPGAWQGSCWSTNY